MSKLSRFKKAPAVKLPRHLSKENSVPPPEDEDDDFQTPPRSLPIPLKEPSVDKEKARGAKPKGKINKVTTTTSSSNEHKNSETCNQSQSEYFANGEQEEVKPSSGKASGSKARRDKIPVTSSAKNTQEKETKEDVNNDEESDGNQRVTLQDEDPAPAPTNGTKAVCPFCWKQLSDKLNGAIHVKACAKNLPTNQVMNAMELQDKQIKEWEELGIAYPGFVGTLAGAGGRRGRGGVTTRAPRTRKKKQDPDLELAMALSASLHEEVEKRKTKERDFMVQNGLAQEVELMKPKDEKQEPAKFQISKTIAELASNAPSRRRGKKINLKDLPLYKASEEDRKQATEGKLSQILDENFDLVQKQASTFNVRDPVPVKSLSLSEKLDAFVNKNSTLWKLSGAESTCKGEFTNQALLDCKARNKEEEEKMPMFVKNIGFEKRSQSPEKKLSTKPISTSLIKDEPKMDTLKTNTGEIQDLHNTPGFKSACNEKRAVFSTIPKKSASIRPKIVEDILNLFLKKEDVNLIVYAKEEKPIKCHKLILKARCPMLTKESVIETSSSGRKREMISLTDFTHNVVKAFVSFMYCGEFNAELSEQELEDVHELSRKYGFDLESELASSVSNQQNVETQTDDGGDKCPDLEKNLDPVSTNDRLVSPGSPDIFDSSPEYRPVDEPQDAIPLRIEKQSFVKNCVLEEEDLFIDEKCSPEKRFSTGFDRRERSVEVDRKLTTSALCADGPSPVDPVMYEDRNGSRDLFEDCDDQYYEVGQNQGVDEVNNDLGDVTNAKPAFGSISEEKRGVGTNNGILDDEIFTQKDPPILLSPKGHGKRGRSASPSSFFGHSTSQLTATQMADYFELKDPHHAHDSPSSQQANKKHKLDFESNVDVVPSENVDLNGNDDSIVLLDADKDKCPSSGSCNTSNFNQLRKDTFGTIGSGKSSDFSRGSPMAISQPSPLPSYSTFSSRINENNALSTPLANPRFSRPLFPKSNPLTSPFLLPQSVPISEPDPFANDMDDSCFANIPSELLDIPIEPPPSYCEKLPPLSQRPPASRPKTKAASGRKNAKHISSDSESVDKDITAPKKTSSKKKQQQRNISLSQDPGQASGRQNPSTPPPTTLPQGNHTPLLNYSTIDTPILKKELKRYGLKPLPRSKAKLILRHIYKETHK